jgi:hypothetical protein
MKKIIFTLIAFLTTLQYSFSYKDRGPALERMELEKLEKINFIFYIILALFI